LFKRILLFLMAVLLLVPTCILAEEGKNLLKNPGFEEVDGDGMPSGWYSDAYQTREGVSIFSTTEQARTGVRAAQVENLDMNDARFAQKVKVEPNTMYRLSGWVKATDILDAGRGANLSVEGVYVFSESLFDTQDEWVYLETYGLTGSDQTEVTVFVRVGGYSGESKGAAAFDDVSLEVVTETPEGVFAEAWFVKETVSVIDPVDEADNGVASPFWPWLLVIAVVYAAVCCWLASRLQTDRRQEAMREAVRYNGINSWTMPSFAAAGIALAFFVRLLTALNVSGYQVDVNCFTAWGSKMANVGPARFYQSNWCDYTPAYIYIMGLNGLIANGLNGLVSASFVHKLLPMVCDLLGSWLIYRLAVEHAYSRRQAGMLAIMFAFNPAPLLNSAAWCQIDSVLCFGLMLVAYFAIHRKWAVVLPLYVLCILVKPQALMLGFLGLAAIIMELVRHYRDAKLWRQMGIGLLISAVLAAAIILPFSPNQESGSWLIELYMETLGSYPYATVNTANLYFLAGANWQGIEYGAADSVCIFLAIIAAAWAVYTFIFRKDRRLTVMEPLLTVCGALLILVTALLCMSWMEMSAAFLDVNWLAKFRLMLAYPFTFFTDQIQPVRILGQHLLIAAAVLAACIAALSVLLARKKRLCLGLCEPVLMLLFCIAFLVMIFCNISWTILGIGAMAMAFVIVLPIFIRSGKLENLPLCGAVIFILLYVFGIKMHERYLFPALFLLGMAYAVRRDRRTLCLLIGTSCVLFINEGIVLDNSLRLGSSMGHLNADNTDLAMILSAMNVAFALLSIWTCHGICLSIGPQDSLKEPKEGGKCARSYEKHPCTPISFKASAKLGLTRKDALLMLVVTAIYSVVTLTTLGSTKAPQNPWKSSAYDECVYLDLGQHYDDFSMMYFCQVSYNNFAVAVSDDAAEAAWSEEYPAQMAEGMCFSWQYLDPSYAKSDGKTEFINANSFADVQKLSGRYVRLNAKQVGLTVNELVFKDSQGNVIPGVTVIGRENGNDASPNYSDPANLLDEQNSLDGEPSWWNSTYFDEIYHARTAFEHMNGAHAYEWTHPPLGKIIMSWFVALFGMTPFGWRFGGALCGILMLPAMYLLVKQLTKRTDMAFVAMMLMTLDCMHFTQTRIATIDSYPVLFIVLSYFFMLRFMQRDIVLDDVKKLLPDLALSGFFMGCGVASKWIGVYAGIGLAVLYFWTCFRHLRMGRQSAEILAMRNTGSYSDAEMSILATRCKKAFMRFVILCMWCLLFFVAVPVLIYLLTYVVHFADRHFSSIGDFLKTVYSTNFGKEYSMLSYHGTPGLGMDHFFYSPWYEWPLMITPMYYASAAFKPEGMSYAIFCFGNPWVWVIGLAGIAYTVYRWAKGHVYGLQGREGSIRLLRDDWDVTPAFILIGLLAQFLPWVLVPRGTYIYHYFASVPFLILGTTLLLHYITLRWPVAGRRIWIGYLILCLIWFVMLFPYASGIMVPESWLDFIRDYPYITNINNYWQSDFLVKLNTFLEKIPVFPHVYHH